MLNTVGGAIVQLAHQIVANLSGGNSDKVMLKTLCIYIAKWIQNNYLINILYI